MVEQYMDPYNINVEYIAYPMAFKLLNGRLVASRDEMAAWVFFGELSAYLNANELRPPPKFCYNYSENADYISPLNLCWFKAKDVENFQPTERYLSGISLINRWCKQPGIDPLTFIEAKIRESRLYDIHPITGLTVVSGSSGFPPIESGLFARSLIESVEISDFGSTIDDQTLLTVGCTAHPSKNTFPSIKINSTYSPSNAVGKLAVKAAIVIEQETTKQASAKQVMGRLQQWADEGSEPSSLIKSNKPKHAVTWTTNKQKHTDYTLSACEKTLEKWNTGRQ